MRCSSFRRTRHPWPGASPTQLVLPCAGLTRRSFGKGMLEAKGKSPEKPDPASCPRPYGSDDEPRRRGRAPDVGAHAVPQLPPERPAAHDQGAGRRAPLVAPTSGGHRHVCDLRRGNRAGEAIAGNGWQRGCRPGSHGPLPFGPAPSAPRGWPSRPGALFPAPQTRASAPGPQGFKSRCSKSSGASASSPLEAGFKPFP